VRFQKITFLLKGWNNKGRVAEKRRRERRKYLCTIVRAIVLLCELNRIHGRSPFISQVAKCEKHIWLPKNEKKKGLEKKHRMKSYIICYLEV
jgi:hypothetical protein